MAYLKKFVVVVHVKGVAPTVHQGGSTRQEAQIEAANLAGKMAHNNGSKVIKRTNGNYRVATALGWSEIQVGRNMEHGVHATRR